MSGRKVSRSDILKLLFFSGAFGYFEVTHDITEYCKAKVFEHIGKRTPIAIRFSTVGKALKLLCIFLHVYHSHTDSNVCVVEHFR